VPVDLLVSVHGFDIPLDDTDRMAAAWERSFCVVVADRGLAGGVVRTNVREHPTATLSSWPRAHGGVLAAVGNLLGGGVERLVVASSSLRVLDLLWGSHWRLDPCGRPNGSRCGTRRRNTGGPTSCARSVTTRWYAGTRGSAGRTGPPS